MSRGKIKKRILKKIYKRVHNEGRLYRRLHKEGRLQNIGKYGKSCVCIDDIVFEENKRGDIVPVGKLYKNNTHYNINRNFSDILRYKRKPLEIISNQVIPDDPASIIRAYLYGRITGGEAGEFFN